MAAGTTIPPPPPTEPTSSSTSWWPWLLVFLALVAVVAFVARSMSAKRLAAADARRRGLASFGDAMAVHDAVEVLPMSAEADRGRLLAEATASLERVDSGFDSLEADPALVEAATEIADVRLALRELRGALQAQAAAEVLDPELLRSRSSDLQAALEAFRRLLSPPASEPGAP